MPGIRIGRNIFVITLAAGSSNGVDAYRCYDIDLHMLKATNVCHAFELCFGAAGHISARLQ